MNKFKKAVNYVLLLNVKYVNQVGTCIRVNVSKNVQMDNMVIMVQRLVKLVILVAQNVLDQQVKIVNNVVMDLIMMVLVLVHLVMTLVHYVPDQKILNAKDVTVDFIFKVKLVCLVFILVQHVQMLRLVILV